MPTVGRSQGVAISRHAYCAELMDLRPKIGELERTRTSDLLDVNEAL